MVIKYYFKIDGETRCFVSDNIDFMNAHIAVFKAFGYGVDHVEYSYHCYEYAKVYLNGELFTNN